MGLEPDIRERREALERRMLVFAGDVLDFVASLPPSIAREVVAKQLLRAATSIGANYREANRGESRADFVHKVCIAEKEASESCYWIELCHLKDLGDASLRPKLLREAGELLAILVTIGRRAKGA